MDKKQAIIDAITNLEDVLGGDNSGYLIKKYDGLVEIQGEDKNIMINLARHNKETEVKATLRAISEMIASRKIPRRVYDEYLAKTPIGFMTADKVYNYLTMSNSYIDDVEEYEDCGHGYDPECCECCDECEFHDECYGESEEDPIALIEDILGPISDTNKEAIKNIVKGVDHIKIIIDKNEEE